MGLLAFFKRRRHARMVAQMADQLAQQSINTVMGRVRRRASTMRLAEARGYVRARALEIVHREMAALQRGKAKLDPALQTEIISMATEAVVVRALAELRSVPKAAPRSTERRAA